MDNVDVKNLKRIQVVPAEKLEHPEQYLYFTSGILDSINVPWCYAFGNALGIYRDDGFVEGDLDVDIMIIADDIDPQKVGNIFDNYYELIRYIKVGEKYHQLAYQDKTGFIIDLCFFYRDGDNYISQANGGKWIDKVDVIGGFMQYRTQYGLFKIPEKIEDYLVARYGDWWVKKPKTFGRSKKSK